MTYKIKNWNKFQHFKDRRPPWVKLYRDLLDDLEWFELDPVSSKNLINLWLIASEYDGYLPSLDILSFRLRLKKQEVTRILSCLGHWLEQDDIKVISEGYQSDSTETETEREKETDIYVNIEDVSLLDCPHEKVISLYHNILPELRQIEVWNETRKGYLKQRWREVVKKHNLKTKEEGLEYFSEFFRFVRESNFLMGKIDRKDGKPFQADLEWILRPTNFAKIIERKYHQ